MAWEILRDADEDERRAQSFCLSELGLEPENLPFLRFALLRLFVVLGGVSVPDVLEAGGSDLGFVGADFVA